MELTHISLPNHIEAKILHPFFHDADDIEHYCVVLTIDELISTRAVNWQYNRPPDMQRVQEIAKFIYSTKHPLDTMLYMNYDQRHHRLEIIDGIHRFMAIQHLFHENKKARDPDNPQAALDYGCEGDALIWFNATRRVLVSLTVNATRDYLITLFETLNKSVVVPSLYMGQQDGTLRQQIEQVTNDWQVRYATHFSSHSRCQTPNTNRDLFMDVLTQVYQRLDLSTQSSQPRQDLLQLLEQANAAICRTPLKHNKSVSATVLTKCRKTGCFLFLYRGDNLVEFLVQYYLSPQKF